MSVLTRSNAYRTVALLSTPGRDSANVATGVLLLRKDGMPFLATASHFAKHVTSETILELPNGVGMRPSVFRLKSLSLGARADSGSADLSLFPLEGITAAQKNLFTNRFLTFDSILGDGAQPVDRDKELTVLGYPAGLGHDSKGALVPLSFRTHVSSDYFYLNDPDYKNPLLLFALETSTLGGYSGAPVLDISSKNPGIVGFIKGNLDVHGGSIAIVTPAIYAKYLM